MSQLRLAGKNIIVTGASRGLGKVIAESCWKQGANLLLAARSLSTLDTMIADFNRSLIRADQIAAAVKLDLGQDNAASELLSYAKNLWPKLDGLVNNAGILGPIGKVWENDWAEWQQTLRVNLLAPVELCRAMAPWMIFGGGASIVNLSGGGATGPRPNFSAYATAKTGLVRFTEILAKELEGSGVRANSIAPGAMATEMLSEILNAGIDKVGADEFNKIENLTASGGAPPERAADLCVYLLSDESSKISGKLLSAQWDPWENLDPHIDSLKSSDVYTLRRIVPEDRGMKW